MAEAGSEAVYDFNCSPCLKNKSAYSEAVKYCPQCNEYFCKVCVGLEGCEHDLLGRGSVSRWGKPSVRHQYDECPRHKSNTIQLYCQTHDTVSCDMCRKAFHKTCGDMKHLSLIASGRVNGGALKKAHRDLKELQDGVEKLHRDRKASLAGVDNAHKRLATEIRRAKSDIVVLLDNLEQRSLKDLDEYKSDTSKRLKSEIQTLDRIKGDLLDLQARISKTTTDETILFSRLKQSKEMIREKGHIVSEMPVSNGFEEAQFIPDTKFTELAKCLQGLGSIVTDIVTVAAKSQTDGAGKGVPPLRYTKLNRPYRVRQKTSFVVRVKQDEQTCDIRGMCQLPDGSIAISDYNNKRLKQLDSRYKVTRHCLMPDYPNDVCNTEAGEVAVALSDGTILFVSVGATLATTRSFSARQGSFGLAYHNQRLYEISCGGGDVNVYDPSGSLLSTITTGTDRRGGRLFSCTNHITVNPQVHCLHVADTIRGIVTVDLKGNLLASFKKPGYLEGAFAVCLDDVGHVFAAEYITGRVLQIGCEWDSTLAEILSPSDGITAFKLCFDAVNTRLFVSSSRDGGDTVTVLQLCQ